MDLHPIFVHFPIALLTIYCILELIRWKRISSQPSYFYLKAILVMLGGLGALASWLTGDAAVEAIRNGAIGTPLSNFRQVASMHEQFAHISLVIFGILASCYAIMWFNRTRYAMFLQKGSLGKIWQICISICSMIIETPVVIFFALAGLIAITITGGLGGMMVYGQNADPFFKIIYNLLF